MGSKHVASMSPSRLRVVASASCSPKGTGASWVPANEASGRHQHNRSQERQQSTPRGRAEHSFPGRQMGERAEHSFPPQPSQPTTSVTSNSGTPTCAGEPHFVAYVAANYGNQAIHPFLDLGDRSVEPIGGHGARPCAVHSLVLPQLPSRIPATGYANTLE